MLRNTLIVTVLSAMLIVPAAAQNTKVDAGGGKGLVVVDLSLLDQAHIDLLRNANIEVLNDNTVQVPINVAATICDVEVNVIASSNDQGNKSCKATNSGVQGLSG
jgi:glutamate dehydrogenase/leucine dehydrogenase